MALKAYHCKSQLTRNVISVYDVFMMYQALKAYHCKSQLTRNVISVFDVFMMYQAIWWPKRLTTVKAN